MAGAFIDITLDTTVGQAVLDALTKKLTDMTPVAKIMGEILTASVRQNFKSGGRPDKWRELSEATLWGVIRGKKAFTKSGEMRVSAKRRLHNKRILVGAGMAGGLMGSIHYAVEPDSVQIGTNKVYGAIHQFGGEAGRKSARVTIPARPYLMMQVEDQLTIKEALINYLTNR